MRENEEIRRMLLEHESRLSRLEVEVKTMNSWMKSIDKKLDNMAETLAYLRGEIKKKNNNGNISTKQYWSLIVALGTNITLLVMLLLQEML